MANLSSTKTQQLNHLLNLHKVTTIVVKEHQLICNRHVIESIISSKKKARKSRRLQNKSKSIQETLQLDEGKEENVEDREDLFKKPTNVEQTQSYAEEDLNEILTHVIKVDPFQEADSNSSDGESSNINMCKKYKLSSMPKVVFKSFLEKKTCPVISKVKETEKVVKCTLNLTDGKTRSSRPKTQNPTKPLKDNKTTIKHKQVKKGSPKKEVQGSSTRRKTESLSHSENEEDSAEALKPFSCNLCEKSFEYPSGLKAHKVSHTGRKAYKCNRCPSRFSQKSHLTRHLLTHNKKKSSKKFKCSTCDSSFHQNYYLQVHMRVHDGKKPYTCNECSKSFSQKSHLNTHLKTHQEKSITCDLCSQTFTLFHHLSTHLKNVHKR